MTINVDTAVSAPEDYQHLIYEVDEEHIAWVTLDRPAKYNAMNRALIAELRAGLLRADADPDVNVIVIKGNGRGFCGGHDLTEDAGDDELRLDPYAYRQHYFTEYKDYLTPWEISKPVVASVHGAAIGKGFELTMMADISIVTSDTELGYAEVRHGIAGFLMFLPWLVGMKAAKDLLLTGRKVSAAECKELGLVTQVVEPDELAAETKRVATIMARIPSGMQRIHKQYLNRVYDAQGLQSAVADYLEVEMFMSVLPTPEYAKFIDVTSERGLRAAIDDGEARFAGLDR
ncbi:MULTISPECIES: enoyl-CoA hydratase/isomerase family protein [Microbacterium]|uniref:enoyl-CoA hydratase/isomerase family protein n=1 Tax=Microbacterium TaxID=33882 RepID=UPI000D65C1DE|nr:MULTISPECIES: enoyl-CoA hydratase/isomerase family protein [Microbacterium]